MKAKGSALVPLREFVLKKFGEQGQQQWLAALPPASRQIHEQPLLTSCWYPFIDGFLVPVEQMCRLFYKGDPRGAWEFARYAADTELHTIYKVFVRISTPEFLMRNAGLIIKSYFSDAEIKIVESGRGMMRMRISNVDTPHVLFDHVVGGWTEQAFEICGCRNLSTSIVQSAVDNREFTEYHIAWE
ncbi:MAG: hypothetical protein QME74_08495 [Candidatus Edwardsbacteria bacterium]|nr:hypothetical protein [Candidatus Edwardsbacteria bacterium]